MENHLLKLVYQEDYICKVLEEILIYDEPNDSVHRAVSIVERA